MINRTELERREEGWLKPYASFSTEAERVYAEKQDETRTAFQRDCHRVYHSKAFRRLQGKRQVLPVRMNDHIRTRLTHTLEVTQIARSLARTNGLNEDLAEAIGLAHDLGHTPFGHAGESALDEVLSSYGLRFEHNEHSLRIVTEIEKRSEEYTGLNLTRETLDGLDKHRTFLQEASRQTHLEGQMVNVADKIAYQAHDLEDALENKIMRIEELQEISIWKVLETELPKGFAEKPFPREIARALISLCARDLTFELEKKARLGLTREMTKQAAGMTVMFSSEMGKVLRDLEKLMWERYYGNEWVKEETEKGREIVVKLAQHFLQKPEDLPEKEKEELKNKSEAEVVRNYVAGMADEFAEMEFKRVNL